MRERVLITGASGFLGYHLIEEALKNNFDVYAAVRKSSDINHLKNLNVQFTHLKYNDADSLTQEIKDKKYDYIIHAAGITKACSKKNFAIVNTLFAYNLAKAAANCGTKKFVFVSSLAALGPLKNLNGLITESTVPTPISAFGKSKLAAEKKISSVTNLNYTFLRPTALYGPRETGIFIFIKQVVKGLEAYIGNVEQKLSFVYAKDFAAVAVKALQAPERSIYNISDGNFYSRYEIADNIKETLSSRSVKFHLPVIFVKIVAGLVQKAGYLRGKTATLDAGKISEVIAPNWNCSIEKAQAELGFYPKYNLPTGLAETLAWYKKNSWL